MFSEQNPHQTYDELLAHLRLVFSLLLPLMVLPLSDMLFNPLNRYRHILIPEYGQKAQLSGTHPVVRQFCSGGFFCV